MIRVIIWSRIVYVTFNGRCGIFDKLWSARIAITKVTFENLGMVVTGFYFSFQTGQWLVCYYLSNSSSLHKDFLCFPSWIKVTSFPFRLDDKHGYLHFKVLTT